MERRGQGLTACPYIQASTGEFWWQQCQCQGASLGWQGKVQASVRPLSLMYTFYTVSALPRRHKVDLSSSAGGGGQRREGERRARVGGGQGRWDIVSAGGGRPPPPSP